MTDSAPPRSTPPPPDDDLPDPLLERRRRWLPSLVWLVPLVAALIGVSLVINAVFERGPTIVISFKSAEGLEPGKTPVKYKDVDIGRVTTITLSKDLSRVLVDVELKKEAEDFAVAGTRFWVVRPRIAASGVSGLNTLLSGSYIGVDAGTSHDTQKQFIGLETPPAVTGDQKGHQYALHADSLGSLDIGSPVFYRRVQVGQVVGYDLDPDGGGVTLRVFVTAPFDRFVGVNTRFWNASGVDVRLDSEGFKLNTQSLAAVLIGGIAFQSPAGQAIGKQAADNASFRLAADEADAMRAPDGRRLDVVLNFNQSLRGLAVGAPVDFRGIEMGRVTAIDVHYDARRETFAMPVTVALYPNRLGRAFAQAVDGNDGRVLQQLVGRGLRAQLRTGNLLTSQLYIALDFFPKAAPARLDLARAPLELPTVPNTLDELQLQVADIVHQLDQVPFAQIGANLNRALKTTDRLFGRLDTQLAPQARDTLAAAQRSFNAAEQTLRQDSPLQSDVRTALQELTRTARSLSTLADYLERHPEALLRGKPADQGDSP